MTSIIKAGKKDAALLAVIGKLSFIESHGSSAAEKDIQEYVNEKYTTLAFEEELDNPENIYHIIYHNTKPAGYSKIIPDTPHSHIPLKNVTKLERLYLLKEFYSLKLGFELFTFNISLSKQQNQAGMWLFVWKENHRAVRFYERAGFKIAGSFDFKLTATHANPNHLMLLTY